jgi:aminoglycoside 3'-phosphotransferase II
VRVQREDGFAWIEKSGSPQEIDAEAAVLKWCAGHLPVALTLEESTGVLLMSLLPGVNLTEAPMQSAVEAIVEALSLIHAMPIEQCPFQAGWDVLLLRGEQRLRAGLVDESDFDETNLGRSGTDILAELQAFAPLPDVKCFTHGDACLQNFLIHNNRLSGILDMGRAGVTHPAQDWALALRSIQFAFGLDGERLLRECLPAHCADEELLRRFRLLDELF